MLWALAGSNIRFPDKEALENIHRQALQVRHSSIGNFFIGEHILAHLADNIKHLKNHTINPAKVINVTNSDPLDLTHHMVFTYFLTVFNRTHDISKKIQERIDRASPDDLEPIVNLMPDFIRLTTNLAHLMKELNEHLNPRQELA